MVIYLPAVIRKSRADLSTRVLVHIRAQLSSSANNENVCDGLTHRFLQEAIQPTASHLNDIVEVTIRGRQQS